MSNHITVLSSREHLYCRYLGSWQFRNIFYCFLTLAAALVVPDMIIIQRWNLKVGVPDELLVFGEATIAPIIRRCIVMPMFIIAAKVNNHAICISMYRHLLDFVYTI